MRMKKLVSRPKKHERAKHSGRSRTIIAAVGVGLALTGAVAASMFASPSAPPSNASEQRVAENKKAQAELAAPAADYAAASSAAPAVPKAPSVTMTGCLERRGDDFRLKDASGTDVPKARSWKSGFLKKSTPAFDIVDASNRLKLKDHVGHRVALTGVLVDREMRARSLKNVGSTCEN
jgi:hypothetical protein